MERKIENLIIDNKPLINLKKFLFKLDLTKYSNCLKIIKKYRYNHSFS